MTDSNWLERFGKLLVNRVRDEAIRESRIPLRPQCSNAIAKRWRALGPEGLVAISKAIPDIVDLTLARLLNAVDHEELKLRWSTDEGDVDLTDNGLCGWYMGEWRGCFTQEDFVDDFADIREAAKHAGERDSS